MRPPQAKDRSKARRLRILYIQKHLRYNSGEERVVEESVARKLCVLGVAVPAPKRDDLTDMKGNTIEDIYGGWGLNQREDAQRRNLEAQRQAQAGDFAKEEADKKKALEAEIERSEKEAEAKTTKKKASKKSGSKGKAFSKAKGESEGDGSQEGQG